MKKENTIRLYRTEEKTGNGNLPDWAKQAPEYQPSKEAFGRWFTNSLEEAEWYIKNEYPSGRIVTVDLPKEVADQYKVSQLKKAGGRKISENPFAFSLRPEREYFLPKEIADKKKEFKGF